MKKKRCTYDTRTLLAQSTINFSEQRPHPSFTIHKHNNTKRLCALLPYLFCSSATAIWNPSGAASKTFLQYSGYANSSLPMPPSGVVNLDIRPITGRAPCTLRIIFFRPSSWPPLGSLQSELNWIGYKLLYKGITNRLAGKMIDNK